MEDYLPQARFTNEPPAGHEANTAHEADTVSVKSLVGFAAILVAVGVFIEVVLIFVMGGFSQQEKRLRSLAPPLFADDSGQFPAPRLQSNPAVELVKMNKEDLGRLNGYGWVDRNTGIAHIPIERAMDILARSGLPAPPAAPAGGGSPSAAGSPAAEKEKSRPVTKESRKP